MARSKSAPLLVALLLVVVGVVVWYGLGSERIPTRRGGAGLAADRAPDADTLAPSALVASDGASEPRRAAPIGADANDVGLDAAPLADGALAWSTVRGRVSDTFGQPIVDARVRIVGEQPIALGHVPPDDGDDEWDVYAATTDAAGAFEIVCPTPTIDEVWLEIDAGRFLEALDENLGPDGDRPALVAGDNDLGEITLRVRGAVEGLACDANGAPLVRQKIELVSEPGWSHTVSTALDGSFRLDSIEPGAALVGVSGPEHFSSSRESVLVEPAAVTTGVRLVAEVVPRLRGRVVTLDREPVAEALLVLSTPDGTRLHQWTGADGRFDLPQLQALPTLELEISAEGHDRWTALAGELSLSADVDNEIVLAPLRELRVLVVDARDGAVVERCSIEVDGYGRSGWEFNDASRTVPPGADGLRRLSVRSALEYDLAIAAETHVTGTLRVDAPIDAEVVRAELHRGHCVEGRVVADGEPRQGSAVFLVHDAALADASASEAQFAEEMSDAHETANSLATLTDAEGRFRFTGIPRARWRVVVGRVEQAELASCTVDVDGGGVHDVGTLAIAAQGRVVGRVLLPAGVAAAGLAVCAGASYVDEAVAVARTDAAGAFEFTLPAADWTFALDDSERIVGDVQSQVTVVAGATVAVELDARERVNCTVELSVRAGETPLEGATAWLEFGGDWITLDPTDSAGRTRGGWPSAASTLVRFQHRSTRMYLGEWLMPPLATNATNSFDVDLPCGTLELAIPRERLAAAHERESQDQRDDSRRSFRFHHDTRDPAWFEWDALRAFDAEGRCRLGHLAAGTWTIRFDYGGERFEQSFTVTAGAATTLVARAD